MDRWPEECCSTDYPASEDVVVGGEGGGGDRGICPLAPAGLILLSLRTGLVV